MRCVLGVPLLLTGCMTLHHVQVGEVDNGGPLGAHRFEVSAEIGGLDEAAVAEVISHTLGDIFAYTSMGPRTGIPRRRHSLSGDLVEKMHRACPSGAITGIISRRETLHVPFGGTEYIRITGYCIVQG